MFTKQYSIVAYQLDSTLLRWNIQGYGIQKNAQWNIAFDNKHLSKEHFALPC